MDYLEIEDAKNGNSLKIYTFWLRDHCRCSDCYNAVTKQRKYNLLDIPADVQALDIRYENDGEKLHIKWTDDHSSTYDINFIRKSQFEHKIMRFQENPLHTPWTQALILQCEQHLHTQLTDLFLSNEQVKQLLGNLIRYGIIFIDNVPANETMTAMAVRRLFPVMKTFFGEMYTFSAADQTHADTAYTKDFLGLHTDNTYFCDAAGLQALHCLTHDGDGGENFFVDGLHAVQELKRRYPKAYELLSTVHVPAEYIEDGQHHKHSAPIIRIDPMTTEFIQLRLNLYDRAVFDTISQNDMHAFYASFRQFLTILQSDDNRFTVKLKPGTIVIYDNWRVCHARHAYTGNRVMTGCYVQRTDFMSKARVEGVIE